MMYNNNYNNYNNFYLKYFSVYWGQPKIYAACTILLPFLYNPFATGCHNQS